MERLKNLPCPQGLNLRLGIQLIGGGGGVDYYMNVQ